MAEKVGMIWKVRVTEMSYIDKIFPNIPPREEVVARYPARKLPDGARVTRFAPSPTGFVHIGNMMGALTDERIAHLSGGIFMLRIEDTDAKREVAGADRLVIDTLLEYGIKFDEGPGIGGAYGPYYQSERRELYHAFAKWGLENGAAYACFMSGADLEKLRAEQESLGLRTGVYGKWARDRDLPPEEVERRIDAGEPYVIRFKSGGNPDNKCVVQDMIHGKIAMPENDYDEVILKGDGLPSYHFAHVVDDTLMGTTLVIRGDEWLPSAPKHIQMFKAFGLKVPKYAHHGLLQKTDGGLRRKLSKRKDPEALMPWYDQEGYPKTAVAEYLMNLLNSGFEDWRRNNPDKNYREYPLALAKMSASSALFDIVKLSSVSKGVIARMSSAEFYDATLAWAKRYSPKLTKILQSHADKARAAFAIERDGTDRPRKDISKWSEVEGEFEYMWRAPPRPSDIPPAEADVIADFLATYDANDDKDAWFRKISDISARHFPNENATRAMQILRRLITGRDKSPDLWAIMRALGRNETLARLGPGK
jgi:glutamyl-tRNA synthetase